MLPLLSSLSEYTPSWLREDVPGVWGAAVSYVFVSLVCVSLSGFCLSRSLTPVSGCLLLSFCL